MRATHVPPVLVLLLIFSGSNPALGRTEPSRTVEKGILTSTEFPKIQIRIDEGLRYVGTFEFQVAGMAKGERYVFVDTPDGKAGRVNRLFIAQFEQILTTSSERYNYDFQNALTIGNHRFRQNTFAFSNQQGRRENPGNEGALTVDFLRARGY